MNSLILGVARIRYPLRGDDLRSDDFANRTLLRTAFGRALQTPRTDNGFGWLSPAIRRSRQEAAAAAGIKGPAAPAVKEESSRRELRSQLH